MADAPLKYTAAEMCAAMRKRYAQPQWAILFEVRNATGFDAHRSADAVAMSLWPSRGLELHGFEIKVSRSDWRNEAKKPEKAEEIAAFCDRWWVVAPPDVVPDAEVPPAWGHLVWDRKRWTIRKDAALTQAKPLTREFLAAVLRKAHKSDEAFVEALIEERDRDRAARFDNEVAAKVKYATHQHKQLTEAVQKFEEASGTKIGDPWTAGDVGKAVKVLRSVKTDSLYDGLFALSEKIERAGAEVREALLEAGFEPPPQKELPLLRRRA